LTWQVTIMLTHAAILYTWKQLLSRAGVQVADITESGCESLGLTVQYGSHIWGTNELPERTVRVIPCAEDAWRALLDTPPNQLEWVPTPAVVPPGSSFSWNDSIPILFRGDKARDSRTSFARQLPDGSLLFEVDIIATAFFMLSRWEETVVPTRDEHGRFPATASVAYKQGFLDRPIVDEYALILREWLRSLLPGWKPNPRRFSVKLTHDVDLISRFPDSFTALRRLGADLVKRRNPRAVCLTALDATARVLAPTHVSNFRRIRYLAELSRTHGLANAAFYFMAAQPGPLDHDYELASRAVRQCIDSLLKQGFEIGLQASYRTFSDPEQLAAEKAHLDSILGNTRYGGRQHYLRFQAPDTWRYWEHAGLEYDSTLAFADHEGFRCGTCHPFHPFDLVVDQEFNLLEWPLAVMDQTLRSYRKLTPEQSEMCIRELARRCSRVEGAFTLLWHNSSLDGEWEPWRKMLERVVGALAEMQRVGCAR